MNANCSIQNKGRDVGESGFRPVDKRLYVPVSSLYATVYVLSFLFSVPIRVVLISSGNSWQENECAHFLKIPTIHLSRSSH